MTKQNQILAVEKGTKQRVYAGVDEIERLVAHRGLIQGQVRMYEPLAEGLAEELPPESQLIQVRVPDQLKRAQEQFTQLWNITATKEWNNTNAKGTIRKDNGDVLLADVPVTFLLFLEKQLTRIKTLIERIVTLDPSYEWEWDAAKNCYSTGAIKTNKTRKTPKVIVKAEATQYHPAQVDVFNEDVTVGVWNTTHLSGAIPAQTQANMLDRVEELSRGVKKAREEANNIDVEDHNIAEDVLNFIFQP